MRKYYTEILDEVNKDISLLDTTYKNDNVLKILFYHNFVEKYKFALPEGEPPYEESSQPEGMSVTNLQAEATKLYIYCRQDLKPLKRETMFIQLLEALHPKEAKIILAIKEQKLESLYPNLTKDVVVSKGFINPVDLK